MHPLLSNLIKDLSGIRRLQYGCVIREGVGTQGCSSSTARLPLDARALTGKYLEYPKHKKGATTQSRDSCFYSVKTRARSTNEEQAMPTTGHVANVAGRMLQLRYARFRTLSSRCRCLWSSSTTLLSLSLALARLILLHLSPQGNHPHL